MTKNTNSKHTRNIFFLLAIVLITLLVYSNSFDCSFHFDDYDNIVNNSKIHNIDNFDAWWNFSPNRRVSMFTFVLNYHFSQEEVFSYHLVNLIVHIINSILIFFLTLKIFQSTSLKSKKTEKEIKIIAFFTAILFAVHPLGTQSVTYIVQRQNAMAAMFYLSALLTYFQLRLGNYSKHKKIALLASMMFLSLLAFFSKENAFTLPIMILVIELFLLGSGRLLSNLKKKNILFLLGGVFVVSAFAIYWFSFSVFNPLQPNQAMGNPEIVTSYTYFLTQLSVIPKYLQMIIIPINQNIDHYVMMKTSIADIGVLAGLSLILALFFLVNFFYNRNRLLSFGIVWFFVAISIEASIIPIQDMFFEHRSYLPSVGIILAVVCIFTKFFYSKHEKLLYVLLGSFVLIFAFQAYQRNKVWKDDISLWSDAVAKSPNKPRPYVNLGNSYESQGNWQKAIEFYSKSIELSDSYSIVYFNRANAYATINDYESAMHDYSRAIEISPNYGTAYYNRGLLYSKIKKHELAIGDYSKAIELNPEFEPAFYNRGLDYLVLGNYQKAVEDLSQSIRFNPEFVISFVNRGVAYLNLQQYEEAIADFDKAAELDPQADVIYYNRGVAYQALANYNNAIEDFEKVISINPNYTLAYFNRANSYFLIGDYENAVKDYKSVILLDPLMTSAQDNLDKANQLKNR